MQNHSLWPPFWPPLFFYSLIGLPVLGLCTDISQKQSMELRFPYIHSDLFLLHYENFITNSTLLYLLLLVHFLTLWFPLPAAVNEDTEYYTFSLATYQLFPRAYKSNFLPGHASINGFIAHFCFCLSCCYKLTSLTSASHECWF